MASVPSYASTPKVGIGQVSVANPNRNGSGAIVSIFTAGVNGSRIDTIALKALATTTAGAIRLFLHDGTNAKLLSELTVPAQTAAATTPSWETSLCSNTMTQFLPIALPSGYSLYASTEKGESFNVIAMGGDF